jgi:NTE family protein
MKIETKTQIMAPARHLPFEVVSLVLQGGGALGAYQAGVYEAMSEANIHPNWIAGISIEAINAAIIAGNPPASRIDRLREFWTQVTSGSPWPWFEFGPSNGDLARNLMNVASANLALTRGANGFFTARPFSPWLQPFGTKEATSFFDTGSLK